MAATDAVPIVPQPAKRYCAAAIPGRKHHAEMRTCPRRSVASRATPACAGACGTSSSPLAAAPNRTHGAESRRDGTLQKPAEVFPRCAGFAQVGQATSLLRDDGFEQVAIGVEEQGARWRRFEHGPEQVGQRLQESGRLLEPCRDRLDGGGHPSILGPRAAGFGAREPVQSREEGDFA